jgi:hypothetical protein
MAQDQVYYPQDYNQPVSQGQNNSPEDGFLRLLIEVENDLNKFEMETLRRKRLQVDLVNKKRTWVPMAPGVKPVCNETGISEIIGQLRSRATTIGRLTKKTKEQIATDMFQFHNALIDLFSARADDWDLDEDLAKPLLESCISIVQDIIYSSLEGFTAINAKSQYSRHETVNANPMDNKPNILGLGGRK